MTAASLPTPPPRLDGEVRLLIGPANFAGQGRAFARAARTVGAQALSFSLGDPTGLTLDADVVMPRAHFEDPDRGAAQEDWVRHFSHVLIEGGRPVTGLQHGLDAFGEAAVLADAGLVVGMLAHGSDVRRPNVHVDREPDSPFRRMEARVVAVRQKYADRWAELIDACPWPFVTTPDLLDDVPRARWAPVVVEADRWVAKDPAERTPAVPTVVHAPSHTAYKGTDLVEAALDGMPGRDRIAYQRLENIPQSDMPQRLRAADIVLDQFALGSYGVAAVEALASGCIVIGHVRPEVRARVLADTGLEVPIVQARAAQVPAVIAELLADPQRYHELTIAGPAFAAAVHDGRRTAASLTPFLSGGALHDREESGH